MQVKLLVISGKNAGRVVPVIGPKFFFGRAANCHLRCRTNMISRHHCAILVGTDFLGIVDLGSKTGTYVNDKRVTGYQKLEAGDHLKAGPFEFELQIAPDAHSEKTPRPAPTRSDRPRTGETSPDETRGVTSETALDDKRKKLEIVGVSKKAQARRTAETTQDAAADALQKLMRGRRRSRDA